MSQSKKSTNTAFGEHSESLKSLGDAWRTLKLLALQEIGNMPTAVHPWFTTQCFKLFYRANTVSRQLDETSEFDEP